MFRVCVIYSHSYTHLILALGIVIEPTVWGFITSKYPGILDIGLPIARGGLFEALLGCRGGYVAPGSEHHMAASAR